MKIPVFLPHKILLYLFNVLGLAIPWEKLQTYWQHLKFAPARGKGHRGHANPVVFVWGHCSLRAGVLISQKITGFWLSIPLWRPKSTRMSQWLLWSLNADLSCGEESHNPLYLAIVRSLNSCIKWRNATRREAAIQFRCYRNQGRLGMVLADIPIEAMVQNKKNLLALFCREF